MFLVGLLKRRSHGIALQQGNLHNQGIAGLLFGGEVLKIDQNREVITSLGSDNEIAIFAVEDLLSAVANEILKASDLEGDEDLGLGFGSGDVEDDAVKVGDGLVDIDGRSSGMRGDGGGSVSASSGAADRRTARSDWKLGKHIPRSETLGEHRLDQDVLVVEQQHGDSCNVVYIPAAVEVLRTVGWFKVSGVGP